MSGKDDFRVHSTAAGKVRRKRKRKDDDLVVVRVGPRVMRAALREAGGDASRLVIISRVRVEVLPARREKKQK